MADKKEMSERDMKKRSMRHLDQVDECDMEEQSLWHAVRMLMDGTERTGLIDPAHIAEIVQAAVGDWTRSDERHDL